MSTFQQIVEFITKGSITKVACPKRSDSGERCEVKKAMKSRGGLFFFALLFTSYRSPLSERLEQAITKGAKPLNSGYLLVEPRFNE